MSIGYPLWSATGSQIQAWTLVFSWIQIHLPVLTAIGFFASSEASDPNQRPKTAYADAQPLSPNNAPVIQSFTGVPSSLNNPGETITFNVSATDPDGDSLAYTINFGRWDGQWKRQSSGAYLWDGWDLYCGGLSGWWKWPYCRRIPTGDG